MTFIEKPYSTLRGMRSLLWFKERKTTVMQIDRVTVFKVSLPFLSEFSHARRKASCAQNIIVEISANQKKIRGFGEGAPRLNIPREAETNLPRAASFIKSRSFPWELDHVSQIEDFVKAVPDREDVNPAVCAVESALLDALGKKEGKPVIAYFPDTYHTDEVQYGAAIPLGDKAKITEICHLINRFGIKQVRVKMNRDVDANRETLETVLSVLGPDCDLRLDPNGIWDADLAFHHLPIIQAYQNNVRVVEEPMAMEEAGFPAFAEKVMSMGITLMACQSAPTLNEVRRICRDGHYRMVNVKLSRSGGFHRALRIIDFLRQQGVVFQIGSHLGESGLLSAAGRGLCLLCRDAIYYDGSLDPFLLAKNTTRTNVSFGPGGMAGPLNGAGLGVEVDDGHMKFLRDEASAVSIQGP